MLQIAKEGIETSIYRSPMGYYEAISNSSLTLFRGRDEDETFPKSPYSAKIPISHGDERIRGTLEPTKYGAALPANHGGIQREIFFTTPATGE